MSIPETGGRGQTTTPDGGRREVIAPEDRLLIFVSSVMDKRVEDLEPERDAAVEAIKSLVLTRPWAFEYSPAAADSAAQTYLGNVDACDIFLMIAGSEITDGVDSEWKRALARQKRRLVFLKRGVEPSPRLDELIAHLDVKYKRFDDLSDLRNEVRAAVISEIVQGYRVFNLKERDYEALADTIRSTPVSFIVRTIEAKELPKVTATLPGLQELYPDFESWTDKKRVEINANHAEAYVATYGAENVGFALTTDKDRERKVRKISTLYVLPQHQHRGVGPRLPFGLIEKAARDGVEKLYVTVSEETREALEPLLSHYGFYIEGVSARRYRTGSSEWIWGKRLVHGRLRAEQLTAFVQRYVLEERGFTTSKTGPGTFEATPRYGHFGGTPQSWLVVTTAAANPNPRYHAAVKKALETRLPLLFISIESLTETPAIGKCLDALDLEALFFPLYVERDVEGLILPILEANVQRLIPSADQQQFFMPTPVQLRTDNVFYRSPDRYSGLNRGSPLFFYETRRRSGKSRLIGEGKLLEFVVDTPEELFARFGNLGVYSLDELRQSTGRKGTNKDKALALKFDWYREIPPPVLAARVKSLLPNFNPITARRLSPMDVLELRKLAKWNVEPLSFP